MKVKEYYTPVMLINNKLFLAILRHILTMDIYNDLKLLN